MKRIIVILLFVFAVSATLVFCKLNFTRRDLVEFYSSKDPIRCIGQSDGYVRDINARKRIAVSNFYVGRLMEISGRSHVSKYIAYRRILADVVIDKFISTDRLEAFFVRTPCGFRVR